MPAYTSARAVACALFRQAGTWATIEQLAREADGLDIILCTSVTLPEGETDVEIRISTNPRRDDEDEPRDAGWFRGEE